MTRVVVPPLPGWQHLSTWYHVGGTVLAVVLAVFTVQVIRRPNPAAIPGLVACGSGAFALILMAFYRVHRRLILDVDGYGVTMHSSLPWLVSPRAWPRGTVGEIRLNRSNGKLLVRIMGKDHVDVYVSPNRDVTEWVARALNDALRGTPPESSPSRSTTRGTLPIPSRRARAAMIAVGIAMFAGGIAMLFMGLPWNALGIYVSIFSAAPMGVALGTQEKEFYL